MGIGPLVALDRQAGVGMGDPEGGEAFVELGGVVEAIAYPAHLVRSNRGRANRPATCRSLGAY
jgi:hypothetical protein